jgi:hypothetical protein
MSGMKYDGGKAQMGLLAPRWLVGVAQVLTFGAKKYAAHNWAGGISYSRLYDAIQRHLNAFWDHEENDPESGISHLLHASCGLMFLYMMTIIHPELDDRHKYEARNQVPNPDSGPLSADSPEHVQPVDPADGAGGGPGQTPVCAEPVRSDGAKAIWGKA